MDDVRSFPGPMESLDVETLHLLQILTGIIAEADAFTWSHSVDVARYAYTVAQLLNLNNENIQSIYIGALLHDIGKTTIPSSILKKAGTLSADEWIIMKTHPEAGFNCLKPFSQLDLRGIPEIVLHHHEHYDGKGYPKGLAGENIPLSARIVAVADCFDAMTSNRVYRNAKDKTKAAQEIMNNAHTQFDPQVAKVFVEFIQSGAQLTSPPYQLQQIILLHKQKSS